MKTLTVKQYCAIVKRLDPMITMRVMCWPWPQEGQSRIEFSNGKFIRLINTDVSGAIVRVAIYAPKPSEIARA